MEEQEVTPIAALTKMYEQLPEDLQQTIFEIVSDFHHFYCRTKTEDHKERKSLPQR